MSDVFEEVNDDIRRDNMAKLWKKYGPWVIGVCVLIVAAVGGSQFYKNYQVSQAEAASNAYDAYLTVLNAEGATGVDGATEFEVVAQSGHAGYIFLSKMAQADAFARDKNLIEAVKLYDIIASDSSLAQNDRDVATIKAAYLLVDSTSLEDIKSRLAAVNVVENAFRFQARELIGLSAYKTEAYSEAQEIFSSLSQNAQTPDSIRGRAANLIALLASKI
ncbi:MAG: tetratricopeptide repeat protein [OCS116 cluster bacterium]|uniref:Ancillary SecYEG translocon subunit/Cell division coordinator CpoB TPR domain-containing protein n=1 Tax=OCS116 cluster bacterium TaxID=2030921 RepID=A0A2A4Z1R3_9PROT|nr:tetratricopeptide repeat protein [OCS116 cluster bacterium]